MTESTQGLSATELLLRRGRRADAASEFEHRVRLSAPKKVGIEMPADIHAHLRMMAAAHRTTIKALIEEAFFQYLIPKYSAHSIGALEEKR